MCLSGIKQSLQTEFTNFILYAAILLIFLVLPFVLLINFSQRQNAAYALACMEMEEAQAARRAFEYFTPEEMATEMWMVVKGGGGEGSAERCCGALG